MIGADHLVQPLLDDSYLRVKRARVHIRALRKMQGRIATVDPNFITVEPHRDADDLPPDPDGVVRVDLRKASGAEISETHRRLFRTPKFIPPPAPPAKPQWAIRFGEAIYNLRAALDYLVYSLAYLDGGRERDGTQFPIRSSPEKFKQAIKGGNLRGIKPAHRTAIQRLQPYLGRHGLDPFWLSRLADFSNPDKHRKLTVVVTKTTGITSWTIPAAVTADVKVNFTASRQISLGDADKTPAIPALESLVTHVTEALDEFAPCFKGQCPH